MKDSDDPDVWMDLPVAIDASVQLAAMTEAYENETLISLTVTEGGRNDKYDDLRITGVVRRPGYVLFRLRPQLKQTALEFHNIQRAQLGLLN